MHAIQDKGCVLKESCVKMFVNPSPRPEHLLYFSGGSLVAQWLLCFWSLLPRVTDGHTNSVSAFLLLVLKIFSKFTFLFEFVFFTICVTVAPSTTNWKLNQLEKENSTTACLFLLCLWGIWVSLSLRVEGEYLYMHHVGAKLSENSINEKKKKNHTLCLPHLMTHTLSTELEGEVKDPWKDIWLK